jgi:hypothetical protein
MVADRFAATRRLPMVEGRVPANPMRQLPEPAAAVDRTQRQRITAVVDSKAVVVDIRVAVAVADMKAADTGNYSLLFQVVGDALSGGAKKLRRFAFALATRENSLPSPVPPFLFEVAR